MDKKFLILTLDHKEAELSVEEFCRRQSIDYIGWVARKSDGVVEDKEIVQRFGEYFEISEMSSTRVIVGKGLKKTMKEGFNPDEYKQLKLCPIVIAVWDLECNDFVDHYQRHSKRYAFMPYELKKAKQAVNDEVAVDIFINSTRINRDFFMSLTHVI